MEKYYKVDAMSAYDNSQLAKVDITDCEEPISSLTRDALFFVLSCVNLGDINQELEDIEIEVFQDDEYLADEIIYDGLVNADVYVKGKNGSFSLSVFLDAVMLNGWHIKDISVGQQKYLEKLSDEGCKIFHECYEDIWYLTTLVNDNNFEDIDDPPRVSEEEAISFFVNNIDTLKALVKKEAEVKELDRTIGNSDTHGALMDAVKEVKTLGNKMASQLIPFWDVLKCGSDETIINVVNNADYIGISQYIDGGSHYLTVQQSHNTPDEIRVLYIHDIDKVKSVPYQDEPELVADEFYSFGGEMQDFELLNDFLESAFEEDDKKPSLLDMCVTLKYKKEI